MATRVPEPWATSAAGRAGPKFRYFGQSQANTAPVINP